MYRADLVLLSSRFHDFALHIPIRFNTFMADFFSSGHARYV